MYRFILKNPLYLFPLLNEYPFLPSHSHQTHIPISSRQPHILSHAMDTQELTARHRMPQCPNMGQTFKLSWILNQSSELFWIQDYKSIIIIILLLLLLLLFCQYMQCMYVNLSDVIFIVSSSTCLPFLPHPSPSPLWLCSTCSHTLNYHNTQQQ